MSPRSTATTRPSAERPTEGNDYIVATGDGNGFDGIARLFQEIDGIPINAVGGLQGP